MILAKKIGLWQWCREVGRMCWDGRGWGEGGTGTGNGMRGRGIEGNLLLGGRVADVLLYGWGVGILRARDVFSLSNFVVFLNVCRRPSEFKHFLFFLFLSVFLSFEGFLFFEYFFLLLVFG